MNHERMREDVMAFFDGELLGEEKLAAENHLKECVECRSLEAGWIRASSLLRTEAPASSERFVSAVMARIEAGEKARESWFSVALSRWFVPVVAGAAFAGYIGLLMAPVAESPACAETVLFSEVEDQVPATWLVSTGVSQDHVFDAMSEEI